MAHSNYISESALNNANSHITIQLSLEYRLGVSGTTTSTVLPSKDNNLFIKVEMILLLLNRRGVRVKGLCSPLL